VSTFLAFGAAIYAYGVSNLEEIKDNWVQYRCNPLYMPLADLVGSDIYTNFTNCTLQATHTYAGVALDPIYKNFTISHRYCEYYHELHERYARRDYRGVAADSYPIIQSTFAKIQNTMYVTYPTVWASAYNR